MRIVAGWPSDSMPRAPSARFHGRATFDEIIRVHIEDELGGKDRKLIGVQHSKLASPIRLHHPPQTLH